MAIVIAVETTACFILFIVLRLEIQRPDGCEWLYDTNYSNDLVFDEKINQTIDAMQIYKMRDNSNIKNHTLPLGRLRYQNLTEEIRDKKEIAAFLQSLQNIKEFDASTDPRDCSPNEALQVFHIIMYNSKLMRIGYVRYFVCSHSDNPAIIPYGESCIVYNVTPPDILKKSIKETSLPKRIPLEIPVEGSF